MTPEVSNAIKDFKMTIPELTVIQVTDYDPENYLICAVKDKNRINESIDPYYKMNKATGEIDNSLVFAAEEDKIFDRNKNHELWNYTQK